VLRVQRLARSVRALAKPGTLTALEASVQRIQIEGPRR